MRWGAYEEVEAGSNFKRRIHVDRAAGRDRHHRHSGGDAPACPAERAGIGAAGILHEQHETTWYCFSELCT